MPKFLGDPIDYVVFDGYTDFRDGEGLAEDIEVVLIDIKSGGARLTKGATSDCSSNPRWPSAL